MNFTPTLLMPGPENLRPQGPRKLFDDLYFIGNKMVGSWVIPTSEGLVLIEGSAEVDHWETCLKPGLEELGFADRKILALLLTHGHMDHYAGAAHIQSATGCDVCLSAKDTLYMATGVENYKANLRDNIPLPNVNRIIESGDRLVFGDHVIDVLDGSGHTPGCLNYSMEVHEGEETHRFLMMGGYGIHGNGNFMGEPYPYGVDNSIRWAFEFSASTAISWEYAKKNNCDVFLNPHPNLCRMYETVEENSKRKPGEPNAFVIGKDGVRRWLLERYEAAWVQVNKYSDIQREYKEEE